MTHEPAKTADPTFRPARRGLAKVLGDLEAAIMEVMWKASPKALPARAVERRIGKARGVQYITIVTVLNNLVNKGLLEREKVRRAFVYRPCCSRAEFVQDISREVVAGVISLDAGLAISSFVEAVEDLAPGELARLKKLLAARQRAEGQ